MISPVWSCEGLELALTGVVAAAGLLRVLIGQVGEEGGALVGELVCVRFEAVGTRELQQLLSELCAVTLECGSVVRHGASDPFV